jgi:hypothetical protein
MTPRRRRVVATLAAVSLAMIPLAAGANGETLEQQHLRLDTQRLEREVGWQANVQRWLPAASVLVALAVALYGVARYLDERKRELGVRAEEGVAHNLERFLDRDAGDAGSSARTIAALRNLDGLAPTNAGGRAPAHRVRVTDAVTAMVRDDLEAFETPSDARLPVICLDNWIEFSDRANTDAELCRTVLERYLTGVRAIAARASVYVAEVERVNGRYRHAVHGPAAGDAGLFPPLVAGFERYVNTTGDTELQATAIREFKDTAPKLGAQLFPSGQ